LDPRGRTSNPTNLQRKERFVKLESYAALRRLDSVNPAQLAVIAAHLRVPAKKGKAVREDDLVAIGTSRGEPVSVAAWPLQVLATPVGRESFIGFWSRSEADVLCLLGYTTPGNEHAAAGVVDEIAACMEETRPKFIDPNRCVLVAGDRWGLTCDILIEPQPEPGDDFGDMFAVESVDAAGVALVARGVRAACRMRAEGGSLRQVWGAELERVQEASRSVQRHRRAETDKARLLRGDQALFERCRTRGADVSIEDAIVLGVAAATSPLLREWLVDQTLARPGSDLTAMWAVAARHASGTQRGIACAFAALAAWRDGDPLALIAGEAALDADDETDFIWAVWHLLETGATPAHLDLAAASSSTAVPEAGLPQE
jgi:hypothetical protein